MSLRKRASNSLLIIRGYKKRMKKQKSVRETGNRKGKEKREKGKGMKGEEEEKCTFMAFIRELKH